jgi:hypothetical protein
MAMLKVLARRGSTTKIKQYLERDGRSLAFDSSIPHAEGDWCEQMDGWRKMCEKTTGRSYYHVVISPDPRDKASLEQVRELATRWVAERYPDSMWVAEYHDDGHIHAHVVINAVGLDEKKIHMDRKCVTQDALALQSLCKEMDLSYFENARVVRSEDGFKIESGDKMSAREQSQGRSRERQRRVRKERERSGEPSGGTRAESAGARWSWLEDVRREVDKCVAGCHDWTEFVSRMERDGYGVTLTKRRGSGVGVTFTHPLARTSKRGGYAVKGWKLDREGGAYSRAGILERMQPSLSDGRTYASYRVPLARKQPLGFVDRLVEQSRRRPRIGAQEIVDAHAWLTSQEIESYSELESATTRLDDEATSAEADLDAAESVLARAREALALAQRLGESPSAPDDFVATARARLRDLGLTGDLEEARAAVSNAESMVDECARSRDTVGRSAEAARAAMSVAKRCAMGLKGEPEGLRAGAGAAQGAPKPTHHITPVLLTKDNLGDAGRLIREYNHELERERWIAKRRSRVLIFAVSRDRGEASGRLAAGHRTKMDERQERSKRR